MDSSSRRRGLWILLAFFFVLTGAVSIYAERHRESRHHTGSGFDQASGRKEGVGGATGQIAAWLLGVANFPVALSILLKASGNLMPQDSNLKEAIGRMNRRQKRSLMKLHYWLNPVAVGVAVFHFMTTECDATAIPEIGLGAMVLVCILGIIVTFKWSPASLRKTIFRFHTSPIALLACISILIIGHSMAE